MGNNRMYIRSADRSTSGGPQDASERALVRAAKQHRLKTRNPFDPALPTFGAGVKHALLADVFSIAETCRLTPRLDAGVARIFGPSQPLTSHVDPRRHAAPYRDSRWPSLAQLLSNLLYVPSLVGVALGLIVDAVVIGVALLVVLPALLIRAVRATQRPKGLFIDRQALVPSQLESDFRKVIGESVGAWSDPDSDGVANQLRVDINRQTMFVSADADVAPVLLAKDFQDAIPVLKALCEDAEGLIDKAWLWAVTDLCTQSLLNGVNAHLIENHVVRFGDAEALMNLNGYTTMTVRRLGPDLVSVRARMEAPQGITLGVHNQDLGNGVHHDPTPLCFEVEVRIGKPRSAGQLPGVRVTCLDISAL